jgi:glucosylceramidase
MPHHMKTLRLAANIIVLACAAACSSWGAHPASAQAVDAYVSSGAGDRIAKKPQLRFESRRSGAADFTIDDTVQYQEIIGFGASFQEAGLITLNSLPPARQEEVLLSLFDPKTGAGLSAMKTVIGATDFQSAGPFYTYADTPGDVELKHFSIARDLGPNGLVTYIKRAQRHGAFTLQATMDYPPNWMLLEGKADQTVDPKHYGTLARYYLRYLQEYAKQGIHIDHLSPFNEPGNYTRIRYSQMRDLIKSHVGPLFAQANINTKLQLSDAALRAWAIRDLPTVLDDPEARKYISSISYHGYDFIFKEPPPDFEPENLLKGLREQAPTLSNSRDFPESGYDFREFGHVAELHKKYPSLALWMTEVCYFDMVADLPSWQLRPLPYYGFDNGDFWGKQIAADLDAGGSGWTYWNMILDEKGGPPLVSPEHGNPEYNVQHPVVILNRQTKEVTYTGLYYYLAHFSKFVRPGSHRIRPSGARAGITLLGFKRRDGILVAELINSLEQDSKITLHWGGEALDLTLPANSISTYLWNGNRPPT